MPADLNTLAQRILVALPEASAVYVFGSAASGALRADSDLDLAVLTPRAPGDLAALRETLSLAADRDVDLVDLGRASTILQMEVLRGGRLLAARRPLEAALFEVRVMREYQELKARRREIEADIARRGAVHA